MWAGPRSRLVAVQKERTVQTSRPPPKEILTAALAPSAGPWLTDAGRGAGPGLENTAVGLTLCHAPKAPAQPARLLQATGDTCVPALGPSGVKGLCNYSQRFLLCTKLSLTPSGVIALY